MSNKPKILVSRLLPQAVEQRIANSYNAVSNLEDLVLTSSDIIEKAHGLDGLLVSATERCDAAFISALPSSIKIIATFSVGYDHIDLQAAKSAGIVVTNTPDILTDATADIAILLMLGAARGAYWGEQMVRNQKWQRWAPTHPLGIDITGATLGILGMGRIGQAVADRAKAFKMDINYFKRTKLDATIENGAAFFDDLDAFLPTCQFLSINCASTEQTRGLINKTTIENLPDGAVIINTARGDIVNDDDLIEALQSGKIAAAGLDVFNNEPDIDPRYRSLNNVFLLPHLGSATPNTRIAMGMRALDNLDAFFSGVTPKDVVNK